ncbi:MAG: hypothetical protein FJY07_01175 [Bacteroidetes bacterium]|nr:hypothetical protein [Bacteroidota bacterium]
MLSKLVFLLPWMPLTKKEFTTRQQRFPGGEKGGMIISADFEMAWAYRYSLKNKEYLVLSRRERKNIPIILKLLNNNKISITWATVGHLMLDHCKPNDHDWMRRILHFNQPWNFVEGDWYDHDPHSHWKQSPEWYAPDLIEQIINSDVKQEIGCHTFSHIDCSDKNCLPGVLEDELKACVQASKKYNLILDSFVFPGRTFGNYQVLKNQGFKIYRIDSKYKLAYPYRDSHGMLCTISSYAFGEKGLGYSKEYSVFKFKRYINKAIRSGTIAHFWFHPSMDEFTLKNIFPEVLKYASEKRNKQELWIGSMGEIASYINKNKLL